MKTITIYTTLCALLITNVINAQSDDSSNAKKPMVIDGKKVRITIDTKNKSEETKDTKIIMDGDTMIMEEELKDVSSDMEQVKKDMEEIRKEIKIVKRDKPHTYTKKYSGDDDDADKKNPTDWFNVDFGFNFLAGNGSLDMPEQYKELELDNGKGCNFNLKIYQQSISMIPEHLYFVYGVGIDWNNYRFRNNVDLLKDSVPLAYNINSGIDYKKNKLVSTYLTVPLMLKVKFNKNKKGDAFQIAAGPQFGYLLNSHIKQKWENDGVDQKRKTSGDYNLAEFRIGYSLYVGYDNINFYARYFPESAFKENKGPDVNTVCLGIAFGGF